MTVTWFSDKSFVIIHFHVFSLNFSPDNRCENSKYLMTYDERRLRGIMAINENIPGSKFETLFHQTVLKIKPKSI